MGTPEKKVFAKTGEKVFTHVGTGQWEANLYDREVTLNRLKPQEWECVDKHSKKVIAKGSTRNEALREAFYVMSVQEGYSAREAVRLDWVLEEQKYRSYGGHKPRRKTKKTNTAKKDSNVVDMGAHKQEKQEREEAEKTQHIGEPVEAPEDREVRENKEKMRGAFSLDKLKRVIEHYRTAHNTALGGWMFYERDDNGEIVGGIQGPFASEEEMLVNILQKEISKIQTR